MKRLLSIILLLCTMVLSSCRPDPFKDTRFFAIYGNSISGKYDICDYTLNSILNAIEFRARPSEIENINLDPIGTDRLLHFSILSRKLMQSASPEETFAFERILEREQATESKYQDYCHRLGRENDIMASAEFVSAYIGGIPSISADGELFGQPAGTDLSSWFTFRDQNIIGLLGTDLTMLELADRVDVYQTAAEFFVQDKMFPLQLDLRLESIPNEITLEELPVIRYVGDDVITVTISIPVTFERYWDWCKALYTNPQAEEKFADGEIRIAIPFIRK